MNEGLSFNTDGGTVTLSKERQNLCLEASWELVSLSRLLPRLIQSQDPSVDVDLALRGISGRMVRLSSALAVGLYDPVVSVKDLRGRILLDGGEG